MPEGSAGARAEQLAALRLAGREILTAPDMADLLDEAAEESLDEWQAANLREMRRARLRSAAVPPRLVEARTRANTACEMAWRTARPASDYAAVLPLLEEVVRLTVEAGEALSAALGCPALRCFARRFRARRPVRGHRSGVRRSGRLSAGLCRRRHRAAGRPAGPATRRPVPGRPPGGARPPFHGGAGFRLRPGPARCQPPSLHRRRAGRYPHHHPLRRSGFPDRALRRPARDRPRAIRGRPAPAMAASAGRPRPRHDACTRASPC